MTATGAQTFSTLPPAPWPAGARGGAHTPPPPLSVAFFSRLADTRPRPRRLEWERLAERLTRHQERADKDGPGWSPAAYRDGTTRGNAHVEAITAVVCDLDHVDPPRARLAALGLAHVLHTTFRHTGGDPRWRLVVPLARPIPAGAWPDVWQRARAYLAPDADAACKDAARFYYLPSCPPGAPHHAERHDGRALDPDDLPPLAAVPAPERRVASPQRAAPPLGETIADGSRNATLASLAGTMRRRGASPGAIEAALRAENAARCTPPLEAAEVERIAANIGRYAPHANTVTLYDAAQRNGTQNGRPHLEEAPGDAKAVANPVIQNGDSLSADECLGSAARWEALGCRLGSTVQPEQIDWLWPGRIALGKFGVLEGDGGEGKSLLLCDLAARLTGNLALPDGSPNPFGEKVPVVLLMAEDGDADTILPRILAAGGDPRYVVLLKHVPDEEGGHFPTIPDDVAHIWRVCKTAGARALIIDPGNAYLSAEVNANNDHSVRRALAQFPDMAADVGMAILWVRHLNKNTAAEPKNRGGGSAAFLNLARTALAVGPSPDDDTGTRRVLAINKINLDVQDVAWAYHPETAYVPRDAHSGETVKTARIVWEGPSTFTAADILTTRPDPEERSAGEVCKQMLLELLAEGSQAERDVWQAISQARISESTYRRCRRTLNVHTWRVDGLGDSGHWMLSLAPRGDAQAVPPGGAAKAFTMPTRGYERLSNPPPSPDGEAPPRAPAPAKAVTVLDDSHSERVSPPSPPATCSVCAAPAARTHGGHAYCARHFAPIGRAQGEK